MHDRRAIVLAWTPSERSSRCTVKATNYHLLLRYSAAAAAWWTSCLQRLPGQLPHQHQLAQPRGLYSMKSGAQLIVNAFVFHQRSAAAAQMSWRTYSSATAAASGSAQPNLQEAAEAAGLAKPDAAEELLGRLKDKDLLRTAGFIGGKWTNAGAKGATFQAGGPALGDAQGSVGAAKWVWVWVCMALTHADKNMHTWDSATGSGEQLLAPADHIISSGPSLGHRSAQGQHDWHPPAVCSKQTCLTGAAGSLDACEQTCSCMLLFARAHAPCCRCATQPPPRCWRPCRS